MKKIIIISSLISLLLLLTFCGGPKKDGNKMALYFCKIEKIQEKMMDAEGEELENLQKEMEELWKEIEDFGKKLEQKYGENNKEAEAKFMEAMENYECL
jgi:peptidoglycan hydrolase CwlO-like protein